MSKLFQSAKIGNLTLANRIVRSATYEGMCDNQGCPTDEYLNLYSRLAQNNIGAIITGCTYITKCGRVMQPKQAGIDDDAKIVRYRQVTDQVHSHNGKIFMQLIHSGRQTTAGSVNGNVKGVSVKTSPYFRSIPKPLNTEEAFLMAQSFAEAALRCKKSGFDGIQLHAAHGYLIHQFLLSSINNRKDIFGIDKANGIGTHFLGVVIDSIRDKCGTNFPLLVKVSGGDDYFNGFNKDTFARLIRFLDHKKVDAIEISYGTMDHALSIFRGKSVPIDLILQFNPRYKSNSRFIRAMRKWILYPFKRLQIKKFSPMYNLPYAKIAKQHTQIPLICVGGFRTKQEMTEVVGRGEADFVSLCRPFICESDLVNKLIANDSYKAKCLDCNMCAVMCDSLNSTKCYFGKATQL